MVLIDKNTVRDGFRKDPDIDLVQWADKYLYLPRESTSEYGKYRSDRTPFVVEPLQELSMVSYTKKVVVMKPTQQAATTMALIFLLGTADMWPGPALMLMPTETMAQSFSKKRVETTINATPRLTGKIKDRQGRTSSNTILEKTYPGGAMKFAGSNSPVAYRSESVKYAIADDFDGFELDIGGEGSPADLLDRRTGTFARHKIYMNSSPTVKGMSNIEKEFELSSQGYFSVPCPVCGEFQYLVFPQLKFDRENLSWVYYECEHCGSNIEENQKAVMLPAGKYIHRFPDRKTRGFTYNAFVSPVGWQNTWAKIAKEFLDAHKDPAKLKVVKNTLFAETFEEEGSQPSWESISLRAEPYKIMTVPDGGLFISAGVDVQDNRLAILVDAWGEYEENWVIFWDEIYGDPGDDKVWNELDKILNRKWQHSDGFSLSILSMAVDTGGHHAQKVYNYCRQRSPIVTAVKGSSRAGQPVVGRPSMQDVDYMGHKIKNGVQLWPVGTDTGKSLIYNRLKILKMGESNPGMIHFPIGLPDDFYKQLTAEKLVTKFIKGYPKPEWVKLGPRNEALDCKNYSYFAALRAGLVYVEWDKLRQHLIAQAQQKPEVPQQRRIVQKQNKGTVRSVKNYQRPGWLNRD